MKIQICCFCVIMLAQSFVLGEDEFLSCFKWMFDTTDDLLVTFDCVYLNDNTRHINYFDNRVINDTCETNDYTTATKTKVSKTFSSATKITLKNCKLPILPHRFLQRLVQVKQITLDGSSIKMIDNETFSDVHSLTKMSLSANDLTVLPGFLFSHTPNITIVDLSLNKIRNIDSNTFRGTTKMLKIINLSHNNIETIDKSMFTDLISLEELNLSYNFIQHFQVDLSKLKDLTMLLLDNNKIGSLDCTIFNLTTTKIGIKMSHNHIKEVDFSCDAHVESLALYIDDNQLTRLTFPKLNFLNGITKIHASRNLIESITFQGNFRQLTELHLDSNNLKELVEWEDTMFPKLTFLDITANQFNCSYLSAFLKELPNTVRLERTQRTSSKESKTIHGINCNDETRNCVQSGLADDVSIVIIWCLLGLLSLAVLILLILSRKIIKKYRSLKVDLAVCYLQDLQNSKD